jgi:hypothetical protein
MTCFRCVALAAIGVGLGACSVTSSQKAATFAVSGAPGLVDQFVAVEKARGPNMAVTHVAGAGKATFTLPRGAGGQAVVDLADLASKSRLSWSYVGPSSSSMVRVGG